MGARRKREKKEKKKRKKEKDDYFSLFLILFLVEPCRHKATKGKFELLDGGWAKVLFSALV
jgi:hypothetical protein